MVDVDAKIFARHYNGRAAHERYVEALSVFHSTFHSSHQLTVLSEDRDIKVIVVVCNHHFAGAVNANPDGVVGETCTTDGA